jgi:hypothetical protein
VIRKEMAKQFSRRFAIYTSLYSRNIPTCTDINYNDQALTNVANPTYLTVSADPLSPPTVENRIAIGVFLPTFEKTLALQYFVMSCVTSK